MTIIDSLTLYTSTQKTVAIGFIIIGFVLILASIYLMLISTSLSQLWQGFKLGALVCGVLITAGGIGYLNFSEKTHNNLISMCENEPANMVIFEQARIQKVAKDYPVYQIVFAAIVALSLIVIVLGRELWTGVAFSVAILFLSIMLIEAHSKGSIMQHYDYVQQISKQA